MAYQGLGARQGLLIKGGRVLERLAEADVGIAMGAAGTDIAIESADTAVMKDDWSLVPQVVHMARRTMGVVRGNLAFTAVYNLVGLSLAAIGILPPALAAAAQSLPDLSIMANSSRLMRQRKAAARLALHLCRQKAGGLLSASAFFS